MIDHLGKKGIAPHSWHPTNRQKYHRTQKSNLSLGESNPGLPRLLILEELGIDKRKSWPLDQGRFACFMNTLGCKHNIYDNQTRIYREKID